MSEDAPIPDMENLLKKNFGEEKKKVSAQRLFQGWLSITALHATVKHLP